MKENNINTIDAYILSCDESIQPKLYELREFITGINSELKEKISWGMPTFYRNHNIISFSANKKHIGLYPGSEAIGFFSDEYHLVQFS